jgi:hypothetical protein
MDLYGDDDPMSPHLKRWAEAYTTRALESKGGYGNVDIYNTDIEKLRPNQRVVHGP